MSNLTEAEINQQIETAIITLFSFQVKVTKGGVKVTYIRHDEKPYTECAVNVIVSSAVYEKLTPDFQWGVYRPGNSYDKTIWSKYNGKYHTTLRFDDKLYREWRAQTANALDTLNANYTPLTDAITIGDHLNTHGNRSLFARDAQDRIVVYARWEDTRPGFVRVVRYTTDGHWEQAIEGTSYPIRLTKIEGAYVYGESNSYSNRRSVSLICEVGSYSAATVKQTLYLEFPDGEPVKAQKGAIDIHGQSVMAITSTLNLMGATFPFLTD